MRSLLFAASLMCLIAAGLGCGVDACRGVGETCAVTSDCCGALICEDNICKLAPTCRMTGQACARSTDCCGSNVICSLTKSICETPTPVRCGDAKCDAPGETQATCCRDCGCATGKICQANRCITKPTGAVCGNMKCESPNETSTSCCTDCGCPAGQACQSNQCKAPTGTTLKWSVVNKCFNGEDIEFRFFAVERGAMWPGGDLVYFNSPGDTSTVPLSCIAGEKICFGADQPLHGQYWGADIDGTAACSDCCYRCANQSVSYLVECP